MYMRCDVGVDIDWSKYTKYLIVIQSQRATSRRGEILPMNSQFPSNVEALPISL
jgi:hypothetical protein